MENKYRAVIAGKVICFTSLSLVSPASILIDEIRPWMMEGNVPDRHVVDNIYENDILRANEASHSLYLVKWMERGLRWGLVCYSRDADMVMHEMGCYTMSDLHLDNPTWDVVGNVHTDKELLSE